jgi:hypothetical protein
MPVAYYSGGSIHYQHQDWQAPNAPGDGDDGSSVALSWCKPEIQLPDVTFAIRLEANSTGGGLDEAPT